MSRWAEERGGDAPRDREPKPTGSQLKHERGSFHEYYSSAAARQRNRIRQRSREHLPSKARRESRQGNRSGHRREIDPRARRQSFTERTDRALIDVAVHRTVSLKDLSDSRFGGHPFTTRNAINSMVRAGWMREHTAKGPKGGRFQVLSVTRQGAERARELAGKYGLTEQATWSGIEKRSELRHDVAIYRASQIEQHSLRQRGFTIQRIRIDAELKRELAQAQRHRQVAAERRRVAERLGLPVRQGKVLVPDAQVEYQDAEGRTGRVNIEVVSEHYSNAAIAAKAAAGFALHGGGVRAGGGSAGGDSAANGTRGGAQGSGRSVGKIAAALGRAARSGSRSGGARGRGRAAAAIEL